MTRNVFPVFSLLIATAVNSAEASDSISAKSETMTPERVAAYALANNPELNVYVASIAAAKGAVRTAGTVRNPELHSELGYKNSRDNSGGASGDGAILAFSFSQTLEYPGRIALRKAIANHDVEVAELHLQQFRLTLAARVRTLAYGISNAQEKSVAAREVASRFQALSDVIAQRPTAGVTPQLEARILDANTLAFRRQEREAALAIATALAELNQLCGRPADTPLKIAAAKVQFSAPALPKLLSAARVNAFDIRVRQVELAQQGFKVALSKNERFPAIAVGPFYSLENATDREHRAGLGISLPLPLWDRNVGNIVTSKARQQQAEASLALTQLEVERRVTQNAATLAAKRTEIENLQGNAVAKFREAAETADRNYRTGAVPLTIYVETQKQYLEVINAVTDLQKDALQAAQELEILTGLKLYREERQR
jgi:cobalt-zinc-cadmium efflux system outer membrane protein